MQALEGRRRVLGAQHPHTLDVLNNLADLDRDQRRYGEAEPLHREVLDAAQRAGDEVRLRECAADVAAMRE